jgi:RHS repeat-associated protein
MAGSEAPDQLISLPAGGGALQGLGEKFAPDLHTGTANFTIPIAVPPGRAGFQPQLQLVYSTGHPNGHFGLGWSLSVPGVTRKTDDGVPRYRDLARRPGDRDTFILSGVEDLVAVETTGDATRYRPRTEGLFADIRRLSGNRLDDYWEVRSRDGLVTYYGVPGAAGTDPGVVANPDDPTKVFSWKLTATEDPFGNRIEYEYLRDRARSGPRHWDQLYLSRVRYVDDVTGATPPSFLVSVDFDYETRPDPFSDYRAGFEIRTTKRCTSITVSTHAGTDRRVRAYELSYRNDGLSGVSLLSTVCAVGFDESGDAERLPPVELGYSTFDPQARRFTPIQGDALPALSIGDASVELVDVFGNGLPDIVTLGDTPRYWRNLGGCRFDLPRTLGEAPAGLRLADPGVQLIDADGDGRTDLLATTGTTAGYFPMRFGAAWSQRSFVPYDVAPTFSLEGTDVRLLDLDGDGLTDILRTGATLECIFNDRDPGKAWARQEFVAAHSDGLSDLDFTDQRVKFADMSGDGLQDIVLVTDGDVVFFPCLGHGRFGRRLRMRNAPRLPPDFDARRLLLGDVDGDGAADLLYVDDREVTLWANRGGSSWSDPIIIRGTPPVTDDTMVRITDLLGGGVAGVLWSRDRDDARGHTYFLDFTGGSKPYLLEHVDNSMGAQTRITYRPSTHFFLEDEKRIATRWRTPLPFPVQVVARIDVSDAFSDGLLTTEYRYHHGYWDGAEREFRGFGLVEELASESIEALVRGGSKLEPRYFSPPTLTRTWFHQGPITEELGDWQEVDPSPEYWAGDPQLLGHTREVNDLLRTFTGRAGRTPSPRDRRIKRDALRTLRGSILRTELYALDGSAREDRPYTVVEHAYRLREESRPDDGSLERPRIFFPLAVAHRTTQWERGDDPLTVFTFTDDFDELGRPLQQSVIGMPRRQAKRRGIEGAVVGVIQPDETRVLATHTLTHYATPPANGRYLHDRVWQVHAFETSAAPVFTESSPDDTARVLADQATYARRLAGRNVTALRGWHPGSAPPAQLRLIGHTISHYDGAAFAGRADGTVEYGAATRSETLAFRDDELNAAYGQRRPAYLDGTAALPPGAPTGFGSGLGYRRMSLGVGGPYQDGYYIDTLRVERDFQAAGQAPHGLAAWPRRGVVVASQNALGHETATLPDPWWFLVEKLTDTAGLTTTAAIDYRLCQPGRVTDPNGNDVFMEYTALGLPARAWTVSRDQTHGGTRDKPDASFSYDFDAYRRTRDGPAPQPISVRATKRVWHARDAVSDETLETIEYSDGFGRLIQQRSQADELTFGTAGDDVGLPTDAGTQPWAATASRSEARVVVSGWQVYDNKGRVVEKYEPFFDEGTAFQREEDARQGQHAEMYYDPRGNPVRTLNPDGSQQCVIYGRPRQPDRLTLRSGDLTAFPSSFEPTPWETYTYDANDLAPLSVHPSLTLPDGSPQPLTGLAPQAHHFTPANALIDVFGHVICNVQRNGGNAATDAYITRSQYDIRGNLRRVVDALGRSAFEHRYDLMSRPLRVENIDAGTRTVVLDALGKLVESRDSKGAVVLREYDALARPLRLWARNSSTASRVTLRERIEYGDRGSPAVGQPALTLRESMREQNCLGRPTQHWDEAGVVRTPRYDFKGNLVEAARQVFSDDALGRLPTDQIWVTDWADPATDAALDDVSYETSARHDALNRPVELVYPVDAEDRRRVLRPRYTRAGLLASVAVADSAAAVTAQTYVERIAYNARGQRALVVYGNGLMSRYAYDPASFRLARLRTEHVLTPRSTDQWRGKGEPVQDSTYTYDLAGNVTVLEERVPNCGVDGVGGPYDRDRLTRNFGYDPAYRLVSATGRACSGDRERRRRLDLASCGYHAGGPSAPDQTNAPDLASPYTETFRYDPVGNMLELAFRSTGQSPTAWRRIVGIGGLANAEAASAPDNRLTSMRAGQTALAFGSDANGNLIRADTSQTYVWDHADRLVGYRVQAGGTPTTEARYLYGADGIRVKKWVRKGARTESTVYLKDVYEDHRSADIPSGRNTSLHVMDDRRRIALVRIGHAHRDDTGPAVRYQLSDHLGSATAVVDQAGAWISREEYFAYGETSLGSFAKKRYRFSGKERDEESRLYYFGVRYYHPLLCRWLSCDPMFLWQGRVDLYGYVSDNPVRYRDQIGYDDDETSRFPAQRPPVLPKGMVSPQQLAAARAQGAIDQAAKGNDPITGAPYTPPVVQEPWYDRAAHFAADRVIKPAIIIVATSPALLEWGLARTVASATEAEFAIGASRAGLSAELQAELESIPALPTRGAPEYTQKILVADESAAVAVNAAERNAVDVSAEQLIAATKQPFEVVGVGKNTLAGAHEVTIVAHGAVDGTGAAVGVNVSAGVSLTPKQMAEYLVNEAGWSGGTLRLSACGTGLPNANGVAYGQELATELAALDAPTVVLAPKGQVGMGTTSGLPLVVQGGKTLPRGQGWEIFE